MKLVLAKNINIFSTQVYLCEGRGRGNACHGVFSRVFYGLFHILKLISIATFEKKT